LFQVLAADKALRDRVTCRPTPTPPGLSSAVCGVSIELLEQDQKTQALKMLEEVKMPPNGVHELD
jgi:hypothetical protein